MSEDDKMKLRYIQEQKDRARSALKSSRKKEKFNLDSSDEDGDVYLGGFTHRGKPLGKDDFNERIAQSSDDEETTKGGKLSEEYVNRMHFGHGGQT